MTCPAVMNVSMLTLRPEGRWLLFFDLDGTIMCGLDDVRPKMIETFQKLRKWGHKVFLATGRAPASIPKAYLEETDGSITLTGALCFFDRQIIFKAGLADKNVLRLIHICERLEVPVFLENERDFCAFGQPEWFTGQDALFYRTATLFLRNVREAEAAIQNGRNFLKGCMGGEAFRRLTGLADRLPEGICPVWAGDCVDLIPEGVDKGKAADLVIRKLHHPKHRTICFGDSDNDLELFRACAIRVAVGEPSPRLMAEMTYKTVSVQKDGAAQIIEALGFLKP